MERKILKILLLLGLGILPIIFNNKLVKDWIIIFLFKGLLSGFLDHMIIKANRVSYPIRYLPKYFKINILFDYLLFPIACVIYNRSTYRSNMRGIILKSFLLSILMTIVEVIFERKTKLIKFKKNWHWYHTLLSESITFLVSRLFIGGVRHFSNKQSFKQTGK